MARVVAVTGATGFIGTHLVRLLADRGYKVRILVRRIPGSHDFTLPDVEAIIGDLRDAEALRRLVSGAHAVVHLAGLVKAASAAEFTAANADGTRAVVEAISAHSDARLIHVSSLAAREPGLSDYARSKNDAESEVRRLSSCNRWTIVRPPVVYGPADRETLGFFQCAKLGFSVIPGPHDQRLSFIYVSDLTEFIRVVIEENQGSAQTFEIDDGTPGGHQWPDIILAMSAAANRSLRKIRLPAAGIRLAACLNAALHRALGQPTMFTPGKARELLHNDWGAHPPADSVRGWEPVHNLVDGFEKTMRWYRLAGWL